MPERVKDFLDRNFSRSNFFIATTTNAPHDRDRLTKRPKRSNSIGEKAEKKKINVLRELLLFCVVKRRKVCSDEMYISSASRRSRKVIKQLTSIEYSLVISRPPDGQVHVIVKRKK